MPISLPDESRKTALSSLSRFCREELETELTDIQVGQLLGFILKEIGPSAYNQGVADAQLFLRDRLADLEATCHEVEFAHWPKSGSVRRK